MKSEPPSDREVFWEALECKDSAAREAVLRSACGADADQRVRVESLLRLHDHGGLFLAGEAEGLTGDPPAEAPRYAEVVEGPGKMIGRYKLLQRIGEGGFGVVYMAEQREPVKRRVALKIIKLGMDTRQVVARFEAERQALALMEHPHIARVLDGGATETGRPFFVMELVRGIPITQFCDENQVPTEERLRLFTEVCSAIQHAHQKGIIHRDIKPSNVLVTMHDHRAVPKVIDFGVAKATQQELTEKTLFTRFHEFIGTPAYMSPEQAQMSGLDIDTRSDIYALGVLLYELLTGRTPFDAQDLLRSGYDEMRRRICEEEPIKPSTRLNTLSQEDRTAVARRRKTDPLQLQRQFRGDLDRIALKAMEKDRSVRYESASALADDVRRYLNDEPVTATAPSMGYRLRKFTRRHRTAVSMAGLVLLLVVSGALASAHFAIMAQRAERHARAEAEITAAVNAFLNEDLFGQADPEANPEAELRVRTLLDRAGQKIQSRFEGRPMVEAAIRSTLGGLYAKLSEYRLADEHLRRAFDLRLIAAGERDPLTLQAMNDLALNSLRQGRIDEALQTAEWALQSARESLGPRHAQTLKCLAQLARIHYSRGDTPAMEQAAREVVDTGRVLRSIDPGDLALALDLLGRVHGRRGEAAKGEALIQEAIALLDQTLGSDHGKSVRARHNLAVYYYNLRYKLDEAEALFVTALKQQRRLLGESHQSTLATHRNLSLLYRSQREPQRALVHLTEILSYQKPQFVLQPLREFQELLPQVELCPLDESQPDRSPIWQARTAVPSADWISASSSPDEWALTDSPVGDELWLRREFQLNTVPVLGPLIILHGAGRLDLFLNTRPVPLEQIRGFEDFRVIVGDRSILASLRPGRNLLAIHAQDLDPARPLKVEIWQRPREPPETTEQPAR